MAVETNKQFCVPARLDHWSREALKTNQHLLNCLNVYFGPNGVSQNLATAVSKGLREMQTLNEQIAEKSSCGLETGEE